MNGSDFESIGKMMMLVGVFLLICGAGLTFGAKFLPMGRLPGDIFIQKENVSFFFPLTSSIIISIVLTLVLNLFFRR